MNAIYDRCYEMHSLKIDIKEENMLLSKVLRIAQIA